MAMVKIKNLKRRMLVFNLEHPEFCKQEGENGVGNPETLTLLPREAKEVNEQVLECAEVKAAINPKKGRAQIRILG